MCIFTLPVERVSNTRIAVGAVDAKRQLTVYQNETVTSMPGTAMVLPVPNASLVNMVDLSKNKWSFDDLDKVFFPRPVSGGGGFGAFGEKNDNSWSFTLPVTKCGGYLVSVVPSLSDLKRIDVNVFTLPADIEQVLQRHYTEGFGFVVCTFQKGETKGHPIAYTHSLTNDGKLFIPTRHEHGELNKLADAPLGQVVHSNVFCDVCKAAASTFGFATQDAKLDFDHTLYLINCVLLASPFTFTDVKESHPRHILQNDGKTFLNQYFAKLLSIQRIEIKNDQAVEKEDDDFAFGGWHRKTSSVGPRFEIQNDDYYAMPIWK